MRITSSGHVNTRINALQVNKLLVLDWGFMMQKTYYKEIIETLTVINGDQV